MVDSLYLNYKSSKLNVKYFLWKIIYTIEEKRLFNYEKKIIKQSNASFFVNQDESNFWSDYGNTICIPNGVNSDLFAYSNKDTSYENTIIFFGKMNYQPNIDAVDWFMKNVFPYINKEIKFLILGSHPSKVLNKYISDRVLISGFVDDPYEIINGSLLSVAPMQTGAGIQNKILEVMALGKIVITSSLGAKPLKGIKNNKNILIEDDGERMAKLIDEIFLNREKYVNLEISSRKFIASNYTWDYYKTKLYKMIESYI